jgi:hydroxymethylglutaryl-CoA lyase
VAALEAGVTTFDASQGGIGGCPYSPGATGNIVTEDLVWMLEAMGLDTGVDLARLAEARRVLAAALPGEPSTATCPTWAWKGLLLRGSRRGAGGHRAG